MTQAIDRLRASAPGFDNLAPKERDAITDFSLLWSFFECRILKTEGNTRAIANVVEAWGRNGELSPDLFDLELAYFRNRFLEWQSHTHLDGAHGLRLQRSDRAPLVRSALDRTDNDPRNATIAVLIFVCRYRNNRFQGVKWGYELVGQLENFTQADNVLMKVLNRHGRL